MIFEPKKILNKKNCKLVMQDYNQLNIYIHDTQLERVNCTKFLGVTVDSELNWKQHITSVENKLSSIIGILYRIRFKITKKAALLIYDALIYSHLSYCNLLWASTYKSSLDKLFILQKRALKNCLNLPKRTETNIVFELADKLSVYQINKLQTASFIFCSVNKITPKLFHSYFNCVAELHTYSTRRNNNLQIIFAKKVVRRNCIKVKGPKLWNDIPLTIRESHSLYLFKRCYKIYLKSSCLNG